MEQPYFISIYLDTRRAKASGKYPVKLRVFTSSPRIQKLYSTIFEFTEDEFNSIWETSKPRKEHKETRQELQALETKANEVAKALQIFTFEQFEKKLYRKGGIGQDVFYQYGLAIERLKGNNQLGTASSYELCLKSIKEFLVYQKGKEITELSFKEITVDWLNEYESYMTKHGKKIRSRTTVGIYLRTLRTVFNNAIADKEIEQEFYPFGKRLYKIPAGRNVKKALSMEQLKRLHEAEPQTPEQERAKDYWFFSYYCNGMNIKDIALLTYKDIQGDRLVFYRAKTINTTKANSRPIVVHLTDFPNKIIEKYGNQNKGAKQFIFPIIENNQSEPEKHKKIKNFISFVNQNLKKLAIANELPGAISSYWARHTYTTKSIQDGASLAFMQERLGHVNPATTAGYIGAFDQETVKEFAEKLANF